MSSTLRSALLRSVCQILMVYPTGLTKPIAQLACGYASPAHSYEVAVIVAEDGSTYTLDTTTRCSHCDRPLNDRDITRIERLMLEDSYIEEDEVW